MIADHNMKVNGRWVRAGETYGDEPVQAAPAEEATEAAEAENTETEPEPVKRVSAGRRKARK